ncbi:hypothetical protein BJ165DRAFT_1613506 [Panaeolus papilionaceus]|nr:hypothetical protein BJ165DRAFT_1613506 [Panaeolus papilionaceus]
MSGIMDLDDYFVDWNLNSLSDPTSEESGSDESEETTSEEGGEVEVRARDEMEGGFDRLVKNICQRDTFNASSLDSYMNRYPGGLPSTTSGPSTACTSTSGPPLLLNNLDINPLPLFLADLYNVLAQHQRAIDTIKGGRLCLADSTNNHTEMKLAKIHEILGETKMALGLVYQVIDSRKSARLAPPVPLARPPPELPKTPPPPSEGGVIKPRLKPAHLRALEAEKEREEVKGWRRWCEVWEGMLREVDGVGDRVAESDFDESAARSPETEPDGNRMAHRLQFDNKTPSPNEIPSRRGLRLFMQYCFIAMKQGQYNVAEEILRYIIVSNAYQPQNRRSAIRIALITSSPSDPTSSWNKPANSSRNNEILRIFLASPASGLKLTDGFITLTWQKYLFSEMKLSDPVVKNPGILRILTRENPITVAIYGQICVAEKSYQSAIFYLLHAYDYYSKSHDLPLSRYRLNRAGHTVPILQLTPPRSAGDGIPDKIPQTVGFASLGHSCLDVDTPGLLMTRIRLRTLESLSAFRSGDLGHASHTSCISPGVKRPSLDSITRRLGKCRFGASDRFMVEGMDS